MTENVFTAMAEQVRAALVALYPELPADILARVQVEPPRDASHGDMATNAALVIAKPARLPPAKIAAALVEKLGALIRQFAFARKLSGGAGGAIAWRGRSLWR